jgi:hypothetical protein
VNAIRFIAPVKLKIRRRVMTDEGEATEFIYHSYDDSLYQQFFMLGDDKHSTEDLRPLATSLMWNLAVAKAYLQWRKKK